MYITRLRIGISVLLISSGVFLFFVGGVSGDSAHNVSGFAWSDTIGWISMHGTGNNPIIDTGGVDSGGSGFLGLQSAFAQSTIEYGVAISNISGAQAETGIGVFSGYAWSPYIGWISFNETDLVGCPLGACVAQVDWTTGIVRGWAKILGQTGSAPVDLGFGSFSEAYIKASPTTLASNDNFGTNVSVSLAAGSSSSDAKDTIIVGAPYKGSTDFGAIYFFERPSANQFWQETAYVQSSNRETNDYFGTSVAVGTATKYGGMAVVGAPGEDGVGNGCLDCGALYTFYKNASGSWYEYNVILRGSQDTSGDRFGSTVALYDNPSTGPGDYLLVGVPGDEGVSGTAVGAGAAYIFESGTNGEWIEKARLKPEVLPGDLQAPAPRAFGSSVAIFGDTAMVGFPGDDTNGSISSNQGSVEVYTKNGDIWERTQILSHGLSSADYDNLNARFGSDIAISGSLAVVGAESEDISEGSGGSIFSGAVHIFERSGGLWQETGHIVNPGGDVDDRFGESVSISGERIVVGASGDDGPGNTCADCGAIYIFEQGASGNWELISVIRPSNPGSADRFGFDVAIDTGTVVSGAPNEDGDGVAIPPNNVRTNAGAVYVFEPLSQPSLSDWDGWISLDCQTGGFCATSNYGVTIDRDTGDFSGFAWGGDPVGWISFNGPSYLVNVDIPPGNPLLCGNTVVDVGEDCDDGNTVTETCLYGETTCNVCNASCQDETVTGSYCGDGLIDSANGEACDTDTGDSDGDGAEFGLSTCETIIGEGSVGTLSCDSLCNIDAASCSEPPPPEVCGDGQDNDEDGFPDADDPGCWGNNYNPACLFETPPSCYDEDILDENNCGNGYCEFFTGETPLTCRADCRIRGHKED